jgi:tRNA G18 (ribose-2'-O)-methylase SpoU
MIYIEDYNDFRISEFTHLRDHSLLDLNLILAESEKIFLQLKSNNKPFVKILCTEKFANKHALTADNVFIADKSLLERISGFKIEFDVLTLTHKPEDSRLEDLDKRIILLNGLTSPENVGSIVRSAAAFNINSIITDEKSCSPFLRRCIRVSMGNIFSMKTHHSIDIRETLQNLKSKNYQILSTANIPGAMELNHFSFPDKCVLIIGSEGHGIDQDILDLSDTILKISINSKVAHLNASNAAAIFLSKMTLV